MNALTQLLYDYAQNYRLPSYLDRDAIDLAVSDQTQALSALKKSLSAGQLELLEQYQTFCRRRQELEMEAVFQAAFSIAREILI